MGDTTELERLIEGFASREGLLPLLAGAAYIAVVLLVSWLVTRRLRQKLSARPLRWKHEADFPGFFGPLLAMALVWATRLVIQRMHWIEQTPMLDLAIPLLVALVVIRFAVYVLHSVLPEGTLLSGSERTISWSIWIGVALYFTGLLPEIRDALDDIAIPIGKERLTLLLAIRAAFSVAVTLAITLWIAKLIEGRLQKSERIEISTRVVVSKLVRAIAVFLAILIALPLVGIDLTALSVLGGAIGVGLGFGLQKIASNYVSGFIILLDHSVRIGDLVTVDGRMGTVQEIASRYTVVKSSDGTESIIPNETLITQSVTNHSFSDKRAVVKVAVVVPFDADLDRVLAVVKDVGAGHPLAMRDPPASATLTRVGEPGIELELAIWIDDVYASQGQIRSDLLKALVEAFRTEGIPFPAPRREIHAFATPETQETPSKPRV
ncbi:hypothetical protein BWI17_00355 [Betaproteobacteria bacterium GR16-43]|nr:hypothetical protein BWI17_00355 [Betaproteobacteria bacterium GR16-43]